MFLVAAVWSLSLAEKAQAAVIRRRQTTNPFVRRVVSSPHRAGRARFGQRINSNNNAVVNAASQPVGTVQLLQVQPQPLSLPIAAATPLVQFGRAVPQQYFVQQQQQQQQQQRAVPVGYFVQQQQEEQESRESSAGYEASEVVVAAARAPATDYAAAEARAPAADYAAAESRAPAVDYSAGKSAEEPMVKEEEEMEEEEEDDAVVQESRALSSGYLSAQPQTVYIVQQQQQPQEQRATAAATDYVVPNLVSESRQGSPAVVRAEPVAILSYSLNSPGSFGFDRAFDYAFEAANGIEQEAVGEMKKVGDAEVMVMRGRYEYTGDDGERYEVDWYADETGFHPTARHLPQPVEIPFPDQKAAVEAQVRFAEEQRARDNAAAAATNSYSASVVAPAEVIEVRELPAYNEEEELSSYQDGLPSYEGLPEYDRAAAAASPVEVVEARDQAGYVHRLFLL